MRKIVIKKKELKKEIKRKSNVNYLEELKNEFRKLWIFKEYDIG